MSPSRDQLRTLLRDHDKRIWSNDELDDMLGHGLSWWNMVSPTTSFDLDELRKGGLPNAAPQQVAVLWASVVLSVTHLLQPRGLKSNIHLGVDERDHYEELLGNAEQRFEDSKLVKARIITQAADDTIWN